MKHPPLLKEVMEPPKLKPSLSKRVAARPGDFLYNTNNLFQKLNDHKTNPPVSLRETSPFVKGGYGTPEVKTLFIKEGDRQAGRFPGII